jgi:hypothetical protein
MSNKRIKGWSYRYEIVRRLTEHPSGTPRMRWHIVKHHGLKRGPSTFGEIYPDPGENISDDALKRRADVHDVTVPVVIVRHV